MEVTAGDPGTPDEMPTGAMTALQTEPTLEMPLAGIAAGAGMASDDASSDGMPRGEMIGVANDVMSVVSGVARTHMTAVSMTAPAAFAREVLGGQMPSGDMTRGYAANVESARDVPAIEIVGEVRLSFSPTAIRSRPSS